MAPIFGVEAMSNRGYPLRSCFIGIGRELRPKQASFANAEYEELFNMPWFTSIRPWCHPGMYS